jgi:molybdopterin molybdotransferase
MVVSVIGSRYHFRGGTINQSVRLDLGYMGSPHRVMDEVRPLTQRIDRLVPLADVLTSIDTSVAPVSPREIDVGDAIGRVLAADVRAGPHPRVPLALRDGYAVRSEETSDAGSYAPAPLSLAVRVDVGAPLPSGADAVASLDAIDDCARPPQALASVAPGEAVLPRGQDADPDTPLLTAGATLRYVDLAILGALGVAQVLVRAPTVRVINVRRDPIARAIATMLIGSIASAASADTSEGSVSVALRVPQADLIVVVGGSGSGEGDDSVRALARSGRVLAHGIGLSPGETSALGLIDAVPVLVVPGRLDAALAVWHVIGARILRLLSASIAMPVPHGATLARKIASTVGLAEFVPVRVENDAVTPLASGYLPWRALAGATGYVLVPAHSEGYAAGAIVPVTRL